MQYLEDFSEGQRIALGEYPVTEAEIIGFASRYDPQVFHTEPDDDRTVALGGLLASGWHTASIFMRLAVDAYLSSAAILTSPGVDELRWLAPVRSGDHISGEIVVESVRPTRSRPDRGVVVTRVRLWNQREEEVMTVKTTMFVMRQPTASE